MSFEEYLGHWARLHGTPLPQGLVRVWLRIAFVVSTPFTRLNPNAITGFGLLLMLAAIYFAGSVNGNYFVASGLVLSVGIVDSLDGIVAVRTSKISSWGAFLDSVVDRFIDVGVGILLIALGASIELAVIAFAIAFVHEYMRAKASGIGLREVGVITPAEKPTRIAIGVMFLVACGVFPEKAAQLANIAVLVWVTLGVFSFAILMRTFRKTLKS